MGKIRTFRKPSSSQPLPAGPVGLFSFGTKSSQDFIVGDVRERATRSVSRAFSTTESEAESPAKKIGKNQRIAGNSSNSLFLQPQPKTKTKPKKKRQKAGSLPDTEQPVVPTKKQRMAEPSQNATGVSNAGTSRNSASDEMSFGTKSSSGKGSTSNAKKLSRISAGKVVKPKSKSSLASSSDRTLSESELRKKNKKAALSAQRQRLLAKKKFDQVVPPNQRFDESTLSQTQTAIAGPSRIAPRAVPGLESFTPLGGNTDLSDVEDNDNIPVVTNKKGRNVRHESTDSNRNKDSSDGTETPQSVVTTASIADMTPPPETGDSEFDGVHLRCLLDLDIESHRQLANHDEDRHMIPLLARAPVKIDCNESEEYPGVRQQGIWIEENCQTGNFFIAPKTHKPMERTSKSIILHVTKGPIVVRSVRFGFDLTTGEPHLLPDVYNTGDYVLISKGGVWGVDNPGDEEISFQYTFCS